MSQIARSVLRRVLRTNQRAISEVVENTLTLPTADRVFYVPNRYDAASGKFIDRDGKHSGAPQLLQYASLSAPVTLYHSSIVGTETATNQGTASVSFAAGSVTIGAGTAWHIVDSVGHVWEFCSALSSTSVVMWDVSGNGAHLVATGLDAGVVTALRSSGREHGSNWLNVHGWSSKSTLFLPILMPSIYGNDPSHHHVFDGFTLKSIDLSLWDTVSGVVSTSSGVSLPTPSGEATHTNVALCQTTNLDSFSISIGSNPANARVAFGTDKDNFIFINTSNGFVYKVASGVLDAYPCSIGYTALNTGDSITVRIFGINAYPYLQYFVNGVIVGSCICSYLSGPALPEGIIKYGPSWRSSAENWESVYIAYNNKTINRYMHLSIDDSGDALIDASVTCDSLWDHPVFGFYKFLNEHYGAKISLYCYYILSNGKTLNDVSLKFKEELIESSSWLKFGFHSYSSTITYDGTVSNSDARIHAELVLGAIRVFACDSSIDYMPRTHAFSGTLGNVKEWLSLGMIGFLSADDSRKSYYHSDQQKKAITSSENIVDYANNVDFVRSSIRVENVENPANTLNDLILSTGTIKGATNELIIFTHEWQLGNQSIIDKLLQCAEWAKTNNVVFAYPMSFRGTRKSSNVGPVKKSITATGQTGTTFEPGATYLLSDDHVTRTATGWTYGTENWAYNADGTPKSVTLDDMEANGLGDRYFHGSKGCALYSADKTGTTASKIERYLSGITGSVQVDSDGNIIIDSQGSMLDAG